MNIKNSQLLIDLFAAYEDACRHKRKTKGVIEFSLNYEERLFELYEDLISRQYTIAPSICFIVTKPVRREIFAGDFRDRIVHHLLFNYLNPFCERVFINESYACRTGKGTSYGIRRADHFIRSVSHNYTRDCYVLKLDISGYFMSINRAILYEKVLKILERYKREVTFDLLLMQWLLEKIIFHDHTADCIRRGSASDWEALPRSKSLFHTAPGCGLPIGNLTSQLFGNVYLNDFDHFAMRIAPSVRYGRYVDDMLFIHEDKQVLHDVVSPVRTFLAEQLALTLHPHKVRLGYYTHGVDFLGARLLCGRSYPRAQLIHNLQTAILMWNKRIARRGVFSEDDITKMRASLGASFGHLAAHQSRHLCRNLLQQCDTRLYLEMCLANIMK